MSRSTDWLLRIACVCAIAYYAWSLASQTVLQLVVQNQTIAALQAQLKTQSAPPVASK